MSIKELAARSQKDFANVTPIVEKRSKMGYISKRKSKKDSRVSNIYILPKADKMKDQIHN